MMNQQHHGGACNGLSRTPIQWVAGFFCACNPHLCHLRNLQMILDEPSEVAHERTQTDPLRR
jgi:hypothetical protein